MFTSNVNCSTLLAGTISRLAPKSLEVFVDLRLDRIVIQRLADATVAPGRAAEVAVLVDHFVTTAPFVILEVTLVVAVQIPEIIGERVYAREIVHMEKRVRWQISPAVPHRRSHYYRDREFAVRVPKHFLRHVFPTV